MSLWLSPTSGLFSALTRRSWFSQVSRLMVIPGFLPRGQSGPAEQEQQQAWPDASLFGLEADSLMRRSIWITDLSQCSPREAISMEPAAGKWQAVPYTARYADKEIAGSMLLAGPETAPPPVRYPLEKSGWYAIHIGLKSFLGYGDTHAVRVKLGRDPCHWLLSQTIGIQTNNRTPIARADWIRYQIQDCFYRCVELKSDELEIAQNNRGEAEPCAIAYIRLVPLEPEEVHTLEERKGRKASGRLICMNDAFSFMYERRPTSREELWEEILPFSETDYRAIYWCTARADNCLHPTKVGTILGTQGRDFPRTGDRYVAESMQILLGKKIDPFQTVLEFAQKRGLEFHASIRVESFSAEPPWDRAFRSNFYAKHPEWRCIDHDGRVIARMSYAMPEVQEHMLSLVRELLAYGVDGINLVFPRAQPYILYEAPVIEAFRRRYGLLPRQVDERDSRLLALRAEFMSDFLRKVRAEVDKASSNGKRLQLSAVVMANEEINRFHALDLRTWARERLIDELCPGPFGMNREEPTPIEVPYFAEVVKGTGCRLCPTLRPTIIKADQAISTALQFYRQGADGFAVFDMNLFQRFPVDWAVWQQLGRREELEHLGRTLLPKITTLQLRTLGGTVVDKYSPRWAY